MTMETRERYERALSDLVAILRQDRTVLAAILCGSLSYADVWDKSDIDLLLVGDESHKERGVCLTEDGIDIHAMITPRSAFRKAIEGGLQSSFFHSYVSKGRLLFTNDESITGLFADLQTVGARDRAMQLLRAGGDAPPALAKAEKWLHVRHDPRYSFVYVLATVNVLARIEVIGRGEIASREVVQQALRLNPAFFERVYVDLIDGPKDTAAIAAALDAIDAYLTERIPTLFGPLFDYLADAGGPRSMTEINTFFRNHVQGGSLDSACEWLAGKGILDKLGTPLRLSEKSRVAVNEAAYYWDGDLTPRPPLPSGEGESEIW